MLIGILTGWNSLKKHPDFSIEDLMDDLEEEDVGDGMKEEFN